MSGISTQGRNTQGVRLISLKESDKIADVSRVVIDEDEEAEFEAGAESTEFEAGTESDAAEGGQQADSE